MPTINVSSGSSPELQDIANALGRSRKVVVVTGAGISTNCGIPDFRSEDGLYSLIQAQYDAALQNPPWENTNTFDIDDRPRKRAKPSYFYEVVAPDGRVVDVIRESPPSSQPEKQAERETRRSQRSRSTTSSLSTLSDLSDSDQAPSISSATSNASEVPLSIHSPMDCTKQPVHVKATTTEVEPKPPSRRSSRRVPQQPEITSIESSSASITVIAPFNNNSSSKESLPTTLTCSARTSITGTSEERPANSRGRLPRQESSSMPKSEDEEPSTQSSQTSRSLPNLKGRDLFDSIIWSDPFTTSIFYMFISSFRNRIRDDVKNTSETHSFIKVLRDGGRLVRNYTQNIDLLEERLGLSTDLSLGTGNRARFHYKTQQEPRPADIGGDSPHNGGVEVVLLHGSLGQLRCGICAKLSSWDDPDREAATLSGQAPDCPQCEDHSNKRTGRGRRSLAVGRLRPDIVLYGEEHPSADLVGPLITHDLGLGPDVMLIMGTSLKVHGLKVLVKEFAKSIHTRGGKVVFVNNTKPPESTWGDVIDYWVEWDCDAWVRDLKERREDIWLPQGSRIEERRESSDDVKPASKTKSRPQALRDDKMNGVFVTFKILDILAGFPDSKGKLADRRRYFEKHAPVVTIREEAAKKGATKSRQSLPAPSKNTKTNSKKRKSCSDLERAKREAKREAELKLKMMVEWAEIRRRFPALPEMPRKPMSELSNNVELTKHHWEFHNHSNHFPNVGKIGWPSEKSMLVSHPPSGSTIPIHYSSKKVVPAAPRSPPVRSLSRPTNHAYGTRSSRRSFVDLSAADTIVVDDSAQQTKTSCPGEEDTIVVSTENLENHLPTPPKSGPLTPEPDTNRIKRMGSIGTILSSSPDVFHDAQESMT